MPLNPTHCSFKSPVCRSTVSAMGYMNAGSVLVPVLWLPSAWVMPPGCVPACTVQAVVFSFFKKNLE